MQNFEYLNEDLTRIEQLVEFISHEQIEFTQKFLINKNNPPSLKSRQLRDFLSGNTEEKNIDIDLEFLGYILEYIESVGDFYTFELIEKILDNEVTLDHVREKNKDSIISKLFHYRYSKAEKGQLATNKCLNDLLGFRVYIDEIENYDLLTENLRAMIGTKDKLDNRLKFHNSCKDDYKAIHIYFNGIDNKYFPWELQIWDRGYAEYNLSSHKNHKQDYLEWKKFVPDDMIKLIER